jgi:PilZ domain
VQQLTRSAGDFKRIMSDARVSRRYPLKELVTFSLTGEDAGSPLGLGVTENVSKTGICFLTDAAVNVGSSISLNLYLRSLRDAEKTILFHAEGTVLRVELTGLRNKVAAEIRFQDDLEEGLAVSSTIQ